MSRFLALHRPVSDRSPRTPDGRPLPATEGTRANAAEAVLVRGPVILVRADTIVAAIPDRERPGGWTSIVQRGDGLPTLQVYESADELYALLAPT